MSKYVIFKDYVGEIMNNVSHHSDSENINISYHDGKTFHVTWVPVSECSFITKEVADIMKSNID